MADERVDWWNKYLESDDPDHVVVQMDKEIELLRMEKDRIVAIGESARRLLAQEIERLSACWSEALGNVTTRNQEIERLRGQLNFANREPPHCPSCSCGLNELNQDGRQTPAPSGTVRSTKQPLDHSNKQKTRAVGKGP